MGRAMGGSATRCECGSSHVPCLPTPEWGSHGGLQPRSISRQYGHGEFLLPVEECLCWPFLIQYFGEAGGKRTRSVPEPGLVRVHLCTLYSLRLRVASVTHAHVRYKQKAQGHSNNYNKHGTPAPNSRRKKANPWSADDPSSTRSVNTHEPSNPVPIRYTGPSSGWLTSP